MALNAFYWSLWLLSEFKWIQICPIYLVIFFQYILLVLKLFNFISKLSLYAAYLLYLMREGEGVWPANPKKGEKIGRPHSTWFQEYYLLLWYIHIHGTCKYLVIHNWKTQLIRQLKSFKSFFVELFQHSKYCAPNTRPMNESMTTVIVFTTKNASLKMI